MADEKSKDKGTDDKWQSHEPNSEFEKYEDLTKTLLKVPKEEVDEKRAEYERERERRKLAG